MRKLVVVGRRRSDLLPLTVSFGLVLAIGDDNISRFLGSPGAPVFEDLLRSRGVTLLGVERRSAVVGNPMELQGVSEEPMRG